MVKLKYKCLVCGKVKISDSLEVKCDYCNIQMTEISKAFEILKNKEN